MLESHNYFSSWSLRPYFGLGVTQHLREDSRDGVRLTQGASVRVEGREQALQKFAATHAEGQQEEAHVRQLFSVTNGGQQRAG